MIPISSSFRAFARRYSIPGAWLMLFLVAVFAYLPALSGPFVLDDFSSIAALGDYNGVVDWVTFKAFVFGGFSGPTGRPLALLTFLIDANNWPTEALPFKRTNLVIHLINGVLLGILTTRILQVLGWQQRDARLVALVSTACWLLHPLLVSTTMYAVQRMAQLSTLFILGGMVSYVYSRSLLSSGRLRAHILMSLSIGVFTFLAVLSKENGILLPLLIGVLEITVYASQESRSQLSRRWSILFLAVPTAVIFVYLGQKFFSADFFDIVPPRDFSIWERVLTQPRIVADYLQNWFIPKLYTTGVFQDHIIKSTTILTPLTTLLALAFHGVLIAIAVSRRKAWPLFSLAILFFYGGHLLESTTLNLELYFEHRNYLSAAFLFLPLITLSWIRLNTRVFVLLTTAMLILLVGFTRYSATVWSSYDSMVQASAHKAPTSVRAQSQYAELLFKKGYIDESFRVLDEAIVNVTTDHPVLYVTRINFLCRLDRLEKSEFDTVRNKVARLPFDSRALKIYNDFAMIVAQKRCPNISIQSVRPMFADMLLHPRNGDPQSLGYSHIQFLIGYVDVYSDKPSEALQAFEKSLVSRPGATHAMAMAALMATRGYYQEALSLSEKALAQLDTQTINEGLVHGVTEADVREFQKTVRADMNARQAGGTSDPAQ